MLIRLNRPVLLDGKLRGAGSVVELANRTLALRFIRSGVAAPAEYAPPVPESEPPSKPTRSRRNRDELETY